MLNGGTVDRNGAGLGPFVVFVTGQSQIEINKKTAPLPGWLSV